MRIFLDVGANEGQTTWRVLTYERIDRIYAFEPAPTALASLHRRYGSNPRVSIRPFGFWNRTCTATLCDEGSIGASVFSDFRNPQPNGRSVPCSFVRATDWFRENLSDGDWVVLKMNCEGCECDILDDLFDSGEWRRLAHILCDFDVRKSPSNIHRKAEIIKRVRHMGVPNFHICETRHSTFRTIRGVLRLTPRQ